MFSILLWKFVVIWAMQEVLSKNSIGWAVSKSRNLNGVEWLHWSPQCEHLIKYWAKDIECKNDARIYFWQLHLQIITNQALVSKVWLYISIKSIIRPLLSRSWLNLFFNLLLAKKVKSGALIGLKQVKRERESKGLVISILDISLRHCLNTFFFWT
jgi:hypothetical protein